jgi:hypothetical protein
VGVDQDGVSIFVDRYDLVFVHIFQHPTLFHWWAIPLMRHGSCLFLFLACPFSCDKFLLLEFQVSIDRCEAA